MLVCRVGSGTPSEPNFPFLEQLQLKKVIYLALDEPTETFSTFVQVRIHRYRDSFLADHLASAIRSRSSACVKNFLALVHQDQKAELVLLGREEGPSNLAICEETVLRALDIILDHTNYPICVLCGQGSHRTGTVVGCLRKLQRWNLTSIFEEYKRYSGTKVRLLNEQFIELFDTDLVQKQYSTALTWLPHRARDAGSNQQQKSDKGRHVAASAITVKIDGMHQSPAPLASASSVLDAAVPVATAPALASAPTLTPAPVPAPSAEALIGAAGKSDYQHLLVPMHAS